MEITSSPLIILLQALNHIDKTIRYCTWREKYLIDSLQLQSCPEISYITVIKDTSSCQAHEVIAQLYRTGRFITETDFQLAKVIKFHGIGVRFGIYFRNRLSKTFFVFKIYLIYGRSLMFQRRMLL